MRTEFISTTNTICITKNMEVGQLLAELAGTGDWQEGMRFRSSVSEGDMQEWLDSLSLS